MSETFFVKSYKKEKLKEKIYSFLVIASSFMAPISFSMLLQNKVNLVLSFLVGTSFIVFIFLFLYLRQLSLKKIESATKDLKKGTKLKRKSSFYTYEIIQESKNFYHLLDSENASKLMISKDRVHQEFEIFS